MSIIQSGHRFSLTDVSATHSKLPVGNYMLKKDPRSGEFYLVQKESFILPKKVYGDHSVVDRWLQSWKYNSNKNLGILLAGLKGTGKTITAQKFCMDSNMPVIIIGEPFEGSDFIDFITDPKLGECIIFIDEFEKVYNRDNQYDMLSLMDGNYSTKLVFLLTVNEERINDYLINRLNRIKYRKAYGDLEFDVVEEVIDDMLINKDHKESIYTFFEKVNMRTFDLLTNLIKEMNLFSEDAIACGKHLNLKPEQKYYNVTEVFAGQEYECYPTEWIPGDDLDISRKSINHHPDYSGNQRSDELERLMEKYSEEQSPKPERKDLPGNWEVELDKDEYEIVERKGKTIIIQPIDYPKVQYRLKEQGAKSSLVF
jgi:DNA polymerase III delta prime subunit